MNKTHKPYSITIEVQSLETVRQLAARVRARLCANDDVRIVQVQVNAIRPAPTAAKVK